MFTAFQVSAFLSCCCRVCLPLPNVQSNNDENDVAKFTASASGMKEIIDIAALNCRVKFDKTDVPFAQRQILGDATETGLTIFAGKCLEDEYDVYSKKYPKVFEGACIAGLSVS